MTARLHTSSLFLSCIRAGMMKAYMQAVLLIFPLFLPAQDLDYVKRTVADLCSEEMAGRGYVRNGNEKAAKYIAKEFSAAGLKPFTPEYSQSLGFPAVAFPHNVTVAFNGTELIAGEDYIVGAGCPAVSGTFELVYVDSETIDNASAFAAFEKSSFYKSFIVIDGLKEHPPKNRERVDELLKNKYKPRGMVYMNQKKLTWSVATEWDKFPAIYVLTGKMKRTQLKITVDIQPEMKLHNTENLVGYFKGKDYPDSFVVFSAHYDHLGMMGKWAMFPGANDNASGVAMMLDIMNYYKNNPPSYSICFMAFTGEEAGLFGSYYYTEHPLFPLKDISMLINLDLMGTGDKGMTVVNATLFPKEFRDLQALNIVNEYLPAVNSRGKAQNSDHYYFSENGVKAFFFYLMGEYGAYHDIQDVPEALTFSRYNEAFKLITGFVNEYQDKEKP